MIRSTRSRLAAALLTALLAAPLSAQGGDPMREIQEIARRVDEQLKEIDRLLLESSKKNQPRKAPAEKLQQAKATSEAVEASMDELIAKLTEMKNQSSGGGQSEDQQQNQQQDQQQDQQQRQQQQGRQQRRENQTPDFVQQPRQPGQQQGEPQQGEPQQQPGGQQPQQPQPQGQPQGGQDAKDPGQNTTGNRQPEPETAPGQPGTGEGSWGELQEYVNSLKNRGSPPKVPEKFRKYWEAYLKNKRGTGGR